MILKNILGLLSSFGQESHEQRLLHADAYFSETLEYYFERSPALFHVVYQFYTTGKVHQANHVCPQDLIDEFKFWKIDLHDHINSCCCMEDEMSESESEADGSEESIHSPFKHLKWGPLRETVWNVIEEPNR